MNKLKDVIDHLKLSKKHVTVRGEGVLFNCFEAFIQLIFIVDMPSESLTFNVYLGIVSDGASSIANKKITWPSQIKNKRVNTEGSFRLTELV